jgi:CubicO group peptidase (beta-lactamase class C family)
MVQSPDWLDFSLSLPLSAPPGSRFAYCGACLIPLGAVVEKQSGMALPAFAQKYLFDPLGIQTPTWWEGPRGIHSPAFGLSLKPRDMAKLGLLVLQKGKWNGKQIVPEKWITEATSPHVLEAKTGNKADYGYLWWQRNVQQGKKKWRVFDAWGVGGQHIFIVPELNVVCVLTGGNYKDGGLAKNSFKIFQEVLGALD